MILYRLNWRYILVVPALAIVLGTIFYSQYLARKIAAEERQKVEQWIAASKAIMNNRETDLILPSLIHNEQQTIPIIETNEQDSIINFINLDSNQSLHDKSFLPAKLKTFKSENAPLELKISDTPYTANRYYYGHTVLLDQVKYFPMVQLFIVALFIGFVIYSILLSNRATQNQVWAGMAKETAHQLGTPISSLEGWIEMLKETGSDQNIVGELQKDVDRLKLVSDRFSKIGSTPHLEQADLVRQVELMVEYIRRRATGKVHITIENPANREIMARISKPLFDWVIENLLKNALDAIEGSGEITLQLKENTDDIYIDVSDTGKGISASNIQRVFDPGYTTKKRGWGLGLSLSKRIIEQFHQGELFVKQSEPGRGTTFRIVLGK
jgi:signal transduction histidine kinase